VLDYETLDSFADAYVPLIAVASALHLVQSAIARRWRLVRRQGVLLLAGLAVAYGLMFLDAALSIWPTFGLDYSTHTAVALVLVIFLCSLSVKLIPVWGASLMLYLALMLYQEYHTLADILTTILVVDLLYWPIACWYRRASSRIAVATPA
jgi:hypothetical protein